MGAATVVAGIFVLLALWGFGWMNYTIVASSAAFFKELDTTSTSGAAIAVGSAALMAYVLYMINYPEGQLARDAAADFKEAKDK